MESGGKWLAGPLELAFGPANNQNGGLKMRKRGSAMSMVTALIVLPEPMTTVIALVLVCFWCLGQRKRSRGMALSPVTVPTVDIEMNS